MISIHIEVEEYWRG